MHKKLLIDIFYSLFVLGRFLIEMAVMQQPALTWIFYKQQPIVPKLGIVLEIEEAEFKFFS